MWNNTLIINFKINVINSAEAIFFWLTNQEKLESNSSTKKNQRKNGNTKST